MLVALDIEGPDNNLNEIGLAAVHCGGIETPPLPSDGKLETFFEENQVQAHSVEARGHDKRRWGWGPKFGDSIIVEADDVAPMLLQVLSILALEHTGNLILVGFSMMTEFAWISKKCSFNCLVPHRLGRPTGSCGGADTVRHEVQSHRCYQSDAAYWSWRRTGQSTPSY